MTKTKHTPKRLPIEKESAILVGVFWFGSREYGSCTECKTWEAAELECVRHKRLGYEKPGISEVRIIHRTQKVYRPREAYMHE